MQFPESLLLLSIIMFVELNLILGVTNPPPTTALYPTADMTALKLCCRPSEQYNKETTYGNPAAHEIVLRSHALPLNLLRNLGHVNPREIYTSVAPAWCEEYATRTIQPVGSRRPDLGNERVASPCHSEDGMAAVDWICDCVHLGWHDPARRCVFFSAYDGPVSDWGFARYWG